MKKNKIKKGCKRIHCNSFEIVQEGRRFVFRGLLFIERRKK